MSEFIGRKEELKTLSKLYEKTGFQMAAIYGKRRIGKTTLLTEFIKDKKAVYYVAMKVGTERNLELLAQEVIRILAPTLRDVSFKKLEHLLSFIGENTQERLVFIIDEIPYWAEKDEGLLSVFQKYADGEWADKNILFILCGSALSFMENKVLSEKSLDENLIELFFNKNGYLYDETRNLLIQEFNDITVVNNIIEQISLGENTLNLIAGKVHESETAVLYSLKKLISVGLVEKRKCITEEKNKKKTQYVLKDQMFRFWYSYVQAAVSSVEIGRGDVYYERVVKPQIHTFMGTIFEEMCKYYTLKAGLDGKLSCFVTEVGTWWGTELLDMDGGKRNQSADIDVVGPSSVDRKIIVGECKFKNEKLDKGIYETLVRRSKAIPVKYPVVGYILFSLSGFSQWIEENTDRKMVQLITLDDMYR